MQFRRLLKYSDKLTHCFTLRHGGVSKGFTSSLNFKTDGKDSKENVSKNLAIICNTININAKDIVKNYQSHSDKIEIVDNNNKKEYLFDNFSKAGYDGFVTKEKNIALLTTAADCNIIVFYDPIKNIVANIHSGWKSSVKQIYLKALKIMKEKFNCDYSNVICCIGPSILKCCWRSKEETIKQMFLKVWSNENEYISYSKDGYFHVDFHHVIIKDLVKEGILKENIIDANICTACNNNNFFSYRKSTLNNEDDFGTMCMITVLK